LRPLLPENARSWSRHVLLPKARSAQIELSAPVEQELRDRLRHVEHGVETLIGKRITINEK
jgi:hypothetical protein